MTESRELWILIFLRLFFDNCLTWTKHVDMMDLNNWDQLRHFYPQDVLIDIYQSLITSHYKYGLLPWEKNISRLELLQKKCVRKHI